MKKDEIEKMKAGSELDILVDEQVVGKSLYDISFQIPCPDYSSDISNAWIVVDKLDKYFRCDMSKCDHRSEMKYEFAFEQRGGNMSYFSIQGYTISEAICKAALLVVNSAEYKELQINL